MQAYKIIHLDINRVPNYPCTEDFFIKKYEGLSYIHGMQSKKLGPAK